MFTPPLTPTSFILLPSLPIVFQLLIISPGRQSCRKNYKGGAKSCLKEVKSLHTRVILIVDGLGWRGSVGGLKKFVDEDKHSQPAVKSIALD